MQNTLLGVSPMRLAARRMKDGAFIVLFLVHMAVSVGLAAYGASTANVDDFLHPPASCSSSSSSSSAKSAMPAASVRRVLQAAGESDVQLMLDHAWYLLVVAAIVCPIGLLMILSLIHI